MSGWTIRIGGTKIKGDTPDKTLKDAAKNLKRAAATAAEALATGDLDKFKELAGQLVLNNNLSTLGAVKAAKEVFPNIPKESFEKVVGAGVLTFISTGDLTLTVYSAADEFFAIYPKLFAEKRPTPEAPATTELPDRPAKVFAANCLKIWKVAREDGRNLVYAGFHAGPATIFREKTGSEFLWPVVDLRAGDIVELTASDNLAPDAEHTVTKAKGIFSGNSENTPGIGTTQVTLILHFEEIIDQAE